MKLTLEEISDLRAYERERDELYSAVIAAKRVRRVQVGPLVSLVFENRDTIRFQIQEMARAERMISDAQIQAELDIYNPLIPEAGELSATMFIELTTEAQLREWLGKLVGIERSVELRIGPDGSLDVVRCEPEESHDEALTRADVTASVHYVRFRLDPGQIGRFGRFETEEVALAIDHPAYSEAATLSRKTRKALLDDLRGPTGPGKSGESQG